MIFGKLAGALFGYMITGSLSGALLGALLGHFFDRGLGARLRDPTLGGGWSPVGGGWARNASVDNAAASQAYFEATFAVMGHVAKADGRVDPAEIALAEALMTRMRLDPDRRREAIARFSAGKGADFRLDAALAPLVSAAPGQTALFVSFLQIQVQTAMADGDFNTAEEAVLFETARLLGVPELVFRQIEMIARMARGEGFSDAGPGASGGDRTGYGSAYGNGGRAGTGRSAPSVADAFAVLGVPQDADRATVKAAWRRQISENHPDKLVSKGLPKEMMDAATERSQTIQKAWDTIREAKGWR